MMNPKVVSHIFSLYGDKPLTERTVLQMLSSLAVKIAGDKSVPPRVIVEYWSLILSACVQTGVAVKDTLVIVQDYESFFPEQLLELFGNIPFVIEGFRIAKLVNTDNVKRAMAALAVAAIMNLRGEL